jgi:hypothetical protein
MNQNKKALFLVIGIILGLFIALSPVIVTGHWYNVSKVMGNLLVADFSLRTISIIIGIIVIYLAVRRYFDE